MALGGCHSPPPQSRKMYLSPGWKKKRQKNLSVLWILKVTATKDYSEFLSLKTKDMSYTLLVVPRGKSVPRPGLGTQDGSNVSVNSSFPKKQRKNTLSKALFPKI